jgi:RNase P protein component
VVVANKDKLIDGRELSKRLLKEIKAEIEKTLQGKRLITIPHDGFY